jgi:uncharacterized membrane protein YgcG
MLKKSLFAVSAIALLVSAPQTSFARSIKDMLSDADLAALCSTVPVGTTTSATITLSDGTTVTGSVHCESEDITVGSDDGQQDGTVDDSSSEDQGVSDDPNDDDQGASSHEDDGEDDHGGASSGEHGDDGENGDGEDGDHSGSSGQGASGTSSGSGGHHGEHHGGGDDN